MQCDAELGEITNRMLHYNYIDLWIFAWSMFYSQLVVGVTVLCSGLQM